MAESLNIDGLEPLVRGGVAWHAWPGVPDADLAREA
jgi:hypothetical protein